MWNNDFELIDFHSHIIPHTDDGARDVDTSIQMLSMLSSQGIDKVVGTSHYFSEKESISFFISRRDEAIALLRQTISEKGLILPTIIPAAEVRIYSGMNKDACLDKLCIANSRKILVEMPYTAWTDWMYNEIYALKARGFVPIMAHVERYIGQVGIKEIEERLLSLDVLVQINADFVLSRKTRKFVKRLIKADTLTVLGSDCHNLGHRRPRFPEALQYITKKYGSGYLKHLMAKAQAIINE